jgi:hypothetical protein
MTEHFPQAFKRFPEWVKNVKNFKQLKINFKKYAGVHAPMTREQVRALGKEARKMGIINTSEEFRFKRNDKVQIRWRDVVSGKLTKKDGTYAKKGEKKAKKK